MNGPIWGKLPAIVKTYDGPTRLCTVEIPGVTDGSSALPQATLCTPIGDRAVGDHPTEIRILAGDPVWVEFEAGDPRFPIIVGYRTPRVGNPVDWRRWRHANIEMTADGILKLNATTIELNASTSITSNAPAIHDNGAVTIVGAGVTHNGVNVGATHVHTEQGDGADVSAPH